MSQLQNIIEGAFEDRANINPSNASREVKEAVASVIADLDSGKLRVASRVGATQDWETHQWLKKAVLLSFRLDDNVLLDGGCTQYFDKVPAKFADYTAEDFKTGGFRVVPGAMVRRGSFIGKNAVLLPSFVNIGAYVGEGHGLKERFLLHGLLRRQLPGALRPVGGQVHHRAAQGPLPEPGRGADQRLSSAEAALVRHETQSLRRRRSRYRPG